MTIARIDGVWQTSRSLTIKTSALGSVTIPAGYRWRVGVGWFACPHPSRALLMAALVHDVAYDQSWTTEHLRNADAAFFEIYAREGGRRWPVPVMRIGLRLWARWSVAVRRRQDGVRANR